MNIISIYESEVTCLSSIKDLQKKCMSQNVQLSNETNKYLLYSTLKKIGPAIAQKAVSKLVASGAIKWNEEDDFEVENILDYYSEDGTYFYLIKWKGWSHAHNTWEPEKNLNCPDLIESFKLKNKLVNASEQKKDNKRKLEEASEEDERITKRSRIDELFRKLVACNGAVTPLSLISQTSPDKLTKSYKGVINCQGLKAPKFNTTSKALLNPRSKAYKQKKIVITNALKEWEKHLNAVNSDPAPIFVENTVDLEGPPENFEYINDYKSGPGIVIPDDPVIGCECTDCFSEKKECCAAQFGVEFAYFKHKRLRIHVGRPIYECNKKCKCGPDCPNRVVQQGRKHKVCVFRTLNGRGWGVKAMQKIKSGTFVMEYVGEVISNEEAEIRGKTYDSVGRTYLFDLDFNGDDCPFTVDAAVYGNVSHFVNHSCDPNLEVYSVWINTLDPRLPRIALFSRRDIEKGEELTFDYMSSKVHSPLEESGIEGTLMENSKEVSSLPGPNSDASEARSSDVDDISSAISISDNDSSVLTTTTEASTLKGDLSQGTLTDVSELDPDSEPIPDRASEMGDASTSAPSATKEYRMVCQCGAKNCRKFVF
ncbi:histone-lysine N-methyltransferase SUV39H2-like [Dreissena polymorpha]|uniref:Histone-lysine N-methyltransferase n=1 Tax=Dreissena polymorpha TaxID=45954 RepID=A0A9D4MMW5_DREPO|nr:histone-lysine N-methyltransferase SUV39H2-like [Dreissena polymorpha]KAH3880143.1 hypothetical protein DPMN_004056 [Dreissena polymorpha]